MSVCTLFLCLFCNIGKDSIPIFKYLSPQDTIVVYSSDIVDVMEYKSNLVYYLSEDAARRVNAVNDTNGAFYYYLKNEKMWIYVLKIDYYAEYIPYGYHVMCYNSSFLIENHCINIGHRIPPMMLNTKGHIKQRHKRMLKRPYNDSMFIKNIRGAAVAYRTLAPNGAGIRYIACTGDSDSPTNC